MRRQTGHPSRLAMSRYVGALIRHLDDGTGGTASVGLPAAKLLAGGVLAEILVDEAGSTSSRRRSMMRRYCFLLRRALGSLGRSSNHRA
jgi:hypothetical protein